MAAALTRACFGRVRMSNDGEQRQVKQVSTRASAARSEGLLPVAAAPAIVAAQRADAAQLDALLAIVTTAGRRATLPCAAREQRAGRSCTRAQPARAGSVRTTATRQPPPHARGARLPRRQGRAPSSAWRSPGACSRKPAARQPQQLALAAPGPRAAGRAALEALLAATLAHAFPLPSFRTQAHPERHVRRIALLDADGLDTRHAAASARGNNLVRWLTALPPNMLDAGGYRALIGQLARRHRLGLTWLDERALRRAGANAFLAVASGNDAAAAPVSRTCATARRAGGAPRSAGRGARRQGHPVRHRRRQPQAAPLDARHAHRHGRQRRGARNPDRARRAARTAGGRCVAGDHREPHRTARLQAAGGGDAPPTASPSR